jgi:signal transduction histidine kinase
LSEKKAQAIHRKDSGPILMSYLNNNEPSAGIVVVSLNNFPPPRPKLKPILLTGFFILLFLGLLLLPYTRFVLKPFDELMKSVNYISEGNFTKLIDISKKDEFSEISETLNNMSLKIREMMHQKERMIAAVSHELRTPLAKIRLGLELLLKEDKGNQKYINRSIEETENLDLLINNLLDASELELNTEKFTLEKLDFKELVKENLEKNKLLFDQKGLKINADFPEKPVQVKVERFLIERVFNNIFSNILKYAPDNSQMDLSMKEEDSKVLLTVRDYGPGVKEEHLAKIFEPFYRTDDSRSRETGGTGLGLAIVRKILELHGGKIWAGSASDNKGGLVLSLVLNVNR